MKLFVELDGEKLEVELKRDGRSVTATVDGRAYELDASEPEPNVFLLKNGKAVHEALVSAAADGQGYLVRTGGIETLATVSDPKHLRGSGASAGEATGHAEI